MNKPEPMTDEQIVDLSDTDLDVMSTLRYGRAVEAARDAQWETLLAARQHKPTGWATPKDRYAVPALFNPYSGEPRDVRDVVSDPHGQLIVPPGCVDMYAAQYAPKEQP